MYYNIFSKTGGHYKKFICNKKKKLIREKENQTKKVILMRKSSLNAQ